MKANFAILVSPLRLCPTALRGSRDNTDGGSNNFTYTFSSVCNVGRLGTRRRWQPLRHDTSGGPGPGFGSFFRAAV